MKKHVFREVEPEAQELQFYFDNDGIRDYDGQHFNYNLFIIQFGHYGRIDGGLNLDDYKAAQERAESIIDGFNDVTDELTDYDGNPITYEMIMDDENISHDKRDALVKWYESDQEPTNTEDIAEFLSIITGESWTATSAHGYCQGDYCEIVYCESMYTEKQAQIHGEIYLGCATEYCFMDLDSDGNPDEESAVYGFILADCQQYNEADILTELCNQEGVKPEETILQLIESQTTRTIYSYRTIDPEPVTTSANLPKAAHTTSTKTH